MKRRWRKRSEAEEAMAEEIGGGGGGGVVSSPFNFYIYIYSFFL